MDKFIGTFFALLLVTTVSFTGMFATQGKNMKNNIKGQILVSYSVTSVNRSPALEVKRL